MAGKAPIRRQARRPRCPVRAAAADELLELMEIMDERHAVDLDPLHQAVLLLHECLREKMSF